MTVADFNRDGLQDVHRSVSNYKLQLSTVKPTSSSVWTTVHRADAVDLISTVPGNGASSSFFQLNVARTAAGQQESVSLSPRRAGATSACNCSSP